jgi:hypothetical protein
LLCNDLFSSNFIDKINFRLKNITAHWKNNNALGTFLLPAAAADRFTFRPKQRRPVLVRFRLLPLLPFFPDQFSEQNRSAPPLQKRIFRHLKKLFRAERFRVSFVLFIFATTHR